MTHGEMQNASKLALIQRLRVVDHSSLQDQQVEAQYLRTVLDGIDARLARDGVPFMPWQKW